MLSQLFYILQSREADDLALIEKGYGYQAVNEIVIRCGSYKRGLKEREGTLRLVKGYNWLLWTNPAFSLTGGRQ